MKTKVIDKIDIEIDNLVDLFRNFKIQTMATEEQLKVITAYLKLPDCIRDLPVYRGSKQGLYDFLDNVDEIIKTCSSILDQDVIPTSYLRAIRNKIQGEADDILSMYGTPLEWATIKSNLINHYSDKRNETSLVKDLHSLYQGNSSIEDFFSRIIEIQSSLITHVKLHDTEEVKNAKEELYTIMCLNTFLAGIREPLGSMIRARNPTNLPEAYNICLAEQNMFYIKHKNSLLVSNNQPIYKRTPPIPSRNFQFNPQILQNQFNRNISSPPIAPKYFNHQPFKPGVNTGPQFRNTFQQPIKKPAILPAKPQPMDTSSIQDRYKQYTIGQNFSPYPNQNRYNFQTNGPPRFQSRELHNIEEIITHPVLEDQYSNDMNEYECEYNNPVTSLAYAYDPDPSQIPLPEEIDDQDFREPASETPSDF